MSFKLFIIPFLIFSLSTFAQTEDTTVVLSVNVKRALQETLTEDNFPDFTSMDKISEFNKSTQPDAETKMEHSINCYMMALYPLSIDS